MVGYILEERGQNEFLTIPISQINIIESPCALRPKTDGEGRISHYRSDLSLHDTYINLECGVTEGDRGAECSSNFSYLIGKFRFS